MQSGRFLYGYEKVKFTHLVILLLTSLVGHSAGAIDHRFYRCAIQLVSLGGIGSSDLRTSNDAALTELEAFQNQYLVKTHQRFHEREVLASHSSSKAEKNLVSARVSAILGSLPGRHLEINSQLFQGQEQITAELRNRAVIREQMLQLFDVYHGFDIASKVFANPIMFSFIASGIYALPSMPLVLGPLLLYGRAIPEYLLRDSMSYVWDPKMEVKLSHAMDDLGAGQWVYLSFDTYFDKKAIQSLAQNGTFEVSNIVDFAKDQRFPEWTLKATGTGFISDITPTKADRVWVSIDELLFSDSETGELKLITTARIRDQRPARQTEGGRNWASILSSISPRFSPLRQ